MDPCIQGCGIRVQQEVARWCVLHLREVLEQTGSLSVTHNDPCAEKRTVMLDCIPGGRRGMGIAEERIRGFRDRPGVQRHAKSGCVGL